MNIGAVPDPIHWDRWPEAKALLEPAKARGDFETVIDPDEALWAIMDGDKLLAVATAWLSPEHYVEVKLIGGKDHPRWLRELDDLIGAAAKQAGATRMIAIGRLGWWRELKHMGWSKGWQIEDHWLFLREL